MCIFCLMTGLLRINITSFSGSCRYGGISKCSNRQGMAKIHLGLTVQRKASLPRSAQLVHIPVTNHQKVGRMHLLKSGRSILLSCMNYTVALTHILDGSIHFLLPLMQILRMPQGSRPIWYRACSMMGLPCGGAQVSTFYQDLSWPERGMVSGTFHQSINGSYL